MLQQTRVETVVPYWTRFLEAFPTVDALADAPLDAVLAQWSGLGYYRRARLLHRGAQVVARELGAVPRTAEGLRAVPGIGAYTAGAIASIAFGEAAPLVDGNVARVLCRVFAIDLDPKSAAGARAIWARAGELVVGEDPGSFNQALMELGATVCTPRTPRCTECPIRGSCIARATERVAELPKVAPRSAPKAQRRLAIVATRGDEVLFGRRRDELVFGGLWEPPTCDPAEGAASLGIELADARSAGTVRHVLSHRALSVRVLVGRLASRPSAARGPEHERFRMLDHDAIGDVGISTLARKILARAGWPGA